MAVVDSMSAVARLRFEAALQDHAAKKGPSQTVRTQAKKRAEELRQKADVLEQTLAWLRS